MFSVSSLISIFYPSSCIDEKQSNAPCDVQYVIFDIICRAQVVGWPPVRSFRKNIMTVQSAKGNKEESGNPAAAFVKVSMDGAPYLRKVDLKMYRSYQELYMALEKMFSSFTIGKQQL